MVKRYYDVGVAIFRFLKAARNRAKEGMSKEQILDFARREFGEVSKLLRKQIDDLFKKGTSSKSKIGEFFGFKNYPKTAQKKKGEVVPFKKKYDPETEKQFWKDVEEEGGMEEFLNKNPIKDEGIMATDEAAKIVKKRTDDIATGDPTGKTSEIMEGLATSINKLKKSAKDLEKTKIDPIEDLIQMQKVQQSMMKGGDMYKQGNVRTAVREFMQSEVKAGRLKLNETDSFRVREYSPLTEDDPIDVFRRYYGEDALHQIDDIAEVFEKGESFKHYEQLLRESVDPSVLTIKKTGAGK